MFRSILVHKDEQTATDYLYHLQYACRRTLANSEKEAVIYIYRQLRNADPADDASAREVIQELILL